MPFDQTNYQPEPIGRQRLRVLADFLPSVPEGQFDLLLWASTEEFVECGTTACACGWATTIPEFKTAGLHLHQDASHSTPSLVFGGYNDFEAAVAFFEISEAQVWRLFSPDHYEGRATTFDVAARIREHLAQTVSAGAAVS